MPRPTGRVQFTTWIELEDQGERLRQNLTIGGVRMRAAPRLEDLDRGPIHDGEEDEQWSDE